MGKSSKKTAPKVDAAPAVISPAKLVKKGKRQAEEEVEKQVIAKKQKKNVAVEQAVQKIKVEAKAQKKKKVDSSSSSEDDSESEEEQTVTKKIVVKTQIKKKEESSSSSEEESDSEDEKPVQKQNVVKAQVKNKADSSSEEDSDSDEEKAPAAKVVSMLPVKNGSISTAAKKNNASSSSEESSSSEDSDEDEGPKVSTTVPKTISKNGSTVVPKKKAESSSSGSESDESSDEDKTAPSKVAAVSKKKTESSDTSDDNDSDEDESDSDEDKGIKKNAPSSKKVEPAKKVDESSESSSDEEEDEAPAKNAVKVAPAKKTRQSSDSSSEEEDEDDEDVKMVDAVSPKTTDFKAKKETPKTPATPQVESKSGTRIFVGNLSFDIEKADVERFFKEAGAIVDISFASDHDGRFKGFAHVEFETPEAAQKALAMNGRMLLNRGVKLDLARERVAYNTSQDRNSSFQKGGQSQGQKIFARGFDRNLGEDEARSLLQEHFSACGEITKISLPVDYESGSIKGIAYIEFKDATGFSQALELDGSEIGDGYLTVEEAKPRGTDNDGGGRGFGRGRGNRGGRGGDWGSGGRRGGRGGDWSSGGRRGRGRGNDTRGRGFNKPSFTSSGKKTTFDEE